jgi:hypothetical protein
MDDRPLSKEELLKRLDKVSRPKVYGLSQTELEEAAVAFCVGCPDPVQAWWLFAECSDQMTDDQLGSVVN